MTELTTARHAEWLISQTDQLADLVQGADLRRRVPTCPDWNLCELVEHIGRGHRSGLGLIRGGLTEPLFVDPALIPVPADAELDGWLRAGARDLVDAVLAAGADRPVWNYLGFDMRAGFWLRRMGHDTAVHRFDACLTLEQPFALDAEMAADGVSEWLTVVNSPGAAAMKPDVAVEMRGTGQTLHLHATDEPRPRLGEAGLGRAGLGDAGLGDAGLGDAGLGDAGEWLIRRDPEGVSWEHGHGKGDVTVLGRASDLLLALLGRIGLDDDRLQILGDRALIEHWVRHVVF